MCTSVQKHSLGPEISLVWPYFEPKPARFSTFRMKIIQDSPSEYGLLEIAGVSKGDYGEHRFSYVYAYMSLCEVTWCCTGRCCSRCCAAVVYTTRVILRNPEEVRVGIAQLFVRRMSLPQEKYTHKRKNTIFAPFVVASRIETLKCAC